MTEHPNGESCQMSGQELEDAVTTLARSFAERLDGLATGDFIREGVLKEALTTLIWDLFNKMPDQRVALAEALENWPELIREAIDEEQKKA